MSAGRRKRWKGICHRCGCKSTDAFPPFRRLRDSKICLDYQSVSSYRCSAPQFGGIILVWKCPNSFSESPLKYTMKTCKRLGCGAVYDDDAANTESECIHHAGWPIFRDSVKTWYVGFSVVQNDFPGLVVRRVAWTGMIS